ncbi:hypothetical protein D9756_000259 [Leucocoprinus leucothites]|uniref:F-box domain-containing protein n=1 Tax=Leucocoprinus leucothites TaxID=201217 RepID=A0A8H5GFQ1_9AGAR|nr:hypothetical protein D9756_000259 [Leucoagaricus leucothites]
MSQQAQKESIPPINTLPHDILSSVFLSLFQHRGQRTILPFQVDLSHVCSYWRWVALSTPRLWSSITLFSEQSLPYVQEWLTRSRNVPLRVLLDLHDADCRCLVNEAWLDHALAPFVSHIHRFRYLSILIHHWPNDSHPVLKIFEDTAAPLLENLYICASFDGRHGTVMGQDFRFPAMLKDGSPKLRSVELRLPRCIPPLSNVTELFLDIRRGPGYNVNTLAAALQTSRNLITLSLRGDFEIGDRIPSHVVNQPRLTFSNLRYLDIEAYGVAGIYFILAFAAPNLESLRFRMLFDENFGSVISQFHRRHGNIFPRLKYFTLFSLTLSHVHSIRKAFPLPPHILYMSSKIRGESECIEDLCNIPGLKVVAFQQRLGSSVNEGLIIDLYTHLKKGSTVEEVLFDAETLSRYSSAGIERLRGLVKVDEINVQTFPDYWFDTRPMESLDIF